MALTLNSLPANIDNSATYNVTTNLVEDATHVNLRVRADITVAAVIVATVEKPKGLAGFDFFDILKSLVPGLSFARNSGSLVVITGNGPLIAYSVVFTEVWENAGVTTTGDTDSPAAKKFVPAVGDGTTFSKYVLSGSTYIFPNLTLYNTITKFFTINPSEYWLVFFTEVVHVELFYSKDGGAYDHATHFDPALGWGVIIINADELMAGVTDNLRIQLGEVGGGKISKVFPILVDTTDIAERVVLEFDGLVGGKEYLAFEGIKDIEFATIRNYYSGSKKNRKPLSFTGINKQTIETRFKDINNTEYLKSLLVSENVGKMLPAYVAPVDVTVITDTVKISNSELFTNQIDIEYEY